MDDDILSGVVAGMAARSGVKSPPAPDASPEDSTLRSVVQDMATRRNAQLAATQRQVGNADEQAKVLQLSRQTGLPPDVVERNRPLIEQQKSARELAQMAADNPVLAQNLLDPSFHTVVQDDLGTLGNIERTVGNLTRYVMGASKDGGLPSDIARAAKLVVQGGASQAAAGLYGFNQFFYDSLGMSDTAAGQAQQRKESEAAVARLRSDLSPQDSVWSRGLASGLTSAGAQAFTMPLGFLKGGQALMLGSMGLITGGQSYGKGRDAGLPVWQAAGYGAADATAEVVTEKFLGVAGLIGDAKAGMGAAKLFMRDIAREIPGEMGATLWQNFNEWSNINPDKTVREFMEEQPAALAETVIATIVGGGAQVGAVRGTQKVLGDIARREAINREAEANALHLESLQQLGTASKTMARDAVTAKGFIAQVADEEGDAPTEFYVDSATFVNVLNQSGMTMQELEAVAPVAAGQIANAQTNVDIRLPVSEFMAAGERITAPLIDHIRIGEDQPTRAEAKQYIAEHGQQLEADLEVELNRRDDHATFRESIAKVQAKYEQQLVAAGRTPDVAKANATLTANWYGTMAARSGMTLEAFAQKYRLDVVSSALGGDRTMEQAPKTLAEVRQAWADMGIENYISEKDGVIDLSQIVVPKGSRGQGIGTQAMQSLVAYADATGQRITLTPDKSFGASSVGRLKQFYKTFGFKENKGRAKDFTTRAGMIRDPNDASILNQSAPDTNDPNILRQNGDAPRAQISLPANITESPAVISLLAGADLSSFIHESGHFFLEVQADLAMRIQQGINAGESVGASERGIVDDMNALLKWFGVIGSPEQSALDTWGAMTLDEKRDSHEKFARGFEAFAFEGKAPSIELQGLFSKFRSWMIQVYQTLRGLNVELNDDVRAVMGRMIASDQAIEEAEAQRNMGPLFKTEEDAQRLGWSKEQYDAYHETARVPTDEAIAALQARGMKDMRWLSRARDKALKARQAEVEEQRREIRSEVRMEVYAEPLYRAWAFLTDKGDEVVPGATVADEVDTTTQTGKLRTEYLREQYGVDENAVWRKLSALHMTSDTSGISHDIVAEIFGFDSGDALVQALAQAMPPKEVIEARTDARMLQMFGDISSPEALARAADEAVHNEARARFIASELQALQAANTVRGDTGKKTAKGSRVTTNLLAKAAKDYAQQIISRLKIRDLRPGQYTAAEARNAKMAEQAFSAGKTDEAAMHKRNQLVNNYAAKAALDAQAEVKSAVTYLRKFDKRIKSIDSGYQDQIDGLLERYALKPASLKTIDARKSFATWYAEQQAAGIEPNVPDKLLNEAGRQHYKDMTLEELRGLVDAIKQIEHMGRLKNKLLLARDQRDFDAIASDIAASIIANGGEVRPVELEGAKGIKPWLEGVAASHRKIASLIREMDGGVDNGPLYQHIGRAMNERGTMEELMIEQATEALREIYAPMVKLKGGLTGSRSKIFIKEINASLTRGGRLSVALNWGNEANRQRIRDGDKWSDAQVQAILKTLTSQELEFVNDVWRYLDSFWPQIADKEHRLTGTVPEKVEAQPFAQMGADGIEVPMRGGYYPLKYDSDRSDRAEQQEAAQVAKEMMQGAFTRATTRRGHTKERVQEVKRAVRKDLNVITQHVTQVVHDLAWHEWLIDTNKLLADDGIVQAIRDHHGPKVLKTLRDGVMGIATADVVPMTDIDKALMVLRSNVTRATMGASLTTAFLQPFGLTQSMVRIGSKHVLRGAARWAGDAARMENTAAWIHEKSEFMRLRGKTFNRELHEIRGAVGGKSATMQAIDGGLFWFMRKMQAVADIPTWVGQYEKSIAAGLDEDASVAMADRAVLEAQGGGQTKDLAEVQRKHPMLTQFYSYFNVTLNLTAEQTAKTDFKNPRAVAGWLGDMALLMAIPAILPSLLMFLIKGGGEDDEAEDWAKRIAKWQLGYLLSTVVGLREASGTLEGFDYAGPPVGRILTDIGKAGKQTVQGEIDEPAVLAYINLMGSAFGIPVSQALRSYKGWKAWDEGEAGPQAMLFGPPPKQ